MPWVAAGALRARCDGTDRHHAAGFERAIPPQSAADVSCAWSHTGRTPRAGPRGPGVGSAERLAHPSWWEPALWRLGWHNENPAAINLLTAARGIRAATDGGGAHYVDHDLYCTQIGFRLQPRDLQHGRRNLNMSSTEL